MNKERYQSKRKALEQLKTEGYQWVVVRFFVGPPKLFGEAVVGIEEYLAGMESGLSPVLEISTKDPRVMTVKLEDVGTSGGEAQRPSEDECLLERTEDFVWVIDPLPMGGERRHTRVYRERPSDI